MKKKGVILEAAVRVYECDYCGYPLKPESRGSMILRCERCAFVRGTEDAAQRTLRNEVFKHLYYRQP